MTIRTNAIQILEENLREAESNKSLREYTESCAESDPNFFRWLFDEEFENDFDSSLSSHQEEEYQDFLNSL